MGETTLGTHRILFEQRKTALYMCKTIVIFSDELYKNSMSKFLLIKICKEIF